MSNKRTALIDADVLRYMIGFACQSTNEDGTIDAEPIENCLHSVKVYVNNIIKNSKSDDCIMFLSKGKNFRYTLYDKYKSKRTQRKPFHYKNIETYIKENFATREFGFIEADDALGIFYDRLKKKGKKPIICTIDKDLDTIPGLHYNFKSEKVYKVSQAESYYNLYKQCLMGDSVDSIPGIPRVGAKKAEKLLYHELMAPENVVDKKGLKEYKDWLHTTSFNAYVAHHTKGMDKDSTAEEVSQAESCANTDFKLNLRLVRILRSDKQYQATKKYMQEIIDNK